MNLPLSRLAPENYSEISVRDLLHGIAMGWIPADRRVVKSILARENPISEILQFAAEPREAHRIDTDPILIALFRHYKAPEALDFYIESLRRNPTDADDGLIEALLPFGDAAVEPLVKLYHDMEEEESGDIAFVLAGLKRRDPRVLELLLDRLEFDAADGAFCLGLYGDMAAREPLEKMLAEIPADETELRRELEFALTQLSDEPPQYEEEPFDVIEYAPELETLDFDILPEDERLQFLDSPSAALRVGAVYSFFNEDLEDARIERFHAMAVGDADANVRGRAWEVLAGEAKKYKKEMLAVMADPSRPVEERAGAGVGLYVLGDDDDVEEALVGLYEEGGLGRAKALEAMWRSLYRGYAKYFGPHLEDEDDEIRRHTLRGIGAFGLKQYCGPVEKLFEDDDFREDALFAYAMAMPGETTRGRVKGYLRKIDDLAQLSPDETQMVMFALDERLRIKGLEPVFAGDGYEV